MTTSPHPQVLSALFGVTLIMLLLCIMGVEQAGAQQKKYTISSSLDITVPVGGRTYFSISPLPNPERGFYMEDMFYASSLQNPFNKSYSYSKNWIGSITNRDLAQKDKVSLIQLYIYLTDYVGKPIPQVAFDNMQKLFDDAKANGFKFILRFAYDTQAGETVADFSDVNRHIDQLEPFIKMNMGLIDIWQMGFVGAWGEGHSSSMTSDMAGWSNLIKRELDIFENRQVTIRTIEQKNGLTLSDDYKKRVGYNNDFFTGSQHPLAPGNDYVKGSSDYQQVAAESPYLKVVGEMPYSGSGEWYLNDVIPMGAVLSTFKEHHYSSFSISHNLKPNIDFWKTIPINSDSLKAYNILFNEEYFTDDKGEPCYRSLYDFIRDHLGYRLYIDPDKTNFSIQNGNLSYNIEIQNCGFSAIHNPRPVYLVFIGSNGMDNFKVALDTNPTDWQPYAPNGDTNTILNYQIKGQVAVTLKGNYKVGLWMPDPTNLLKDNASYCIQLANRNLSIWEDDANKYKVNILGSLNF